MEKGFLTKIIICVGVFSIALCGYLNARNDVTKLMIKLPKVAQELTLIEEKNTILQYEVDRFQNPNYLLSLLTTKEYSNLIAQSDNSQTAMEIIVHKPLKKSKKIKRELFNLKAILGSIFP